MADQKRNIDTCATCRRPAEKPAPPPADLPRHVEIEETAAQLRIGWVPDMGASFLLGAPVSIGMFALALYMGLHAVLVIAFGAIAVMSIVITVGAFVNRVEVVVRDGQLVASTKPIGWTRSYATHGIEQVFVGRESREHGADHAVYVVVRGEKHLLLSAIRTPERAFFLERELERRLGIADAPVRGEVPRRPAAR